MNKETQHTYHSIEQQIARLLVTVLPVMGAIIILLIVTLFSVNSRYTAVLMSAIFAHAILSA